MANQPNKELGGPRKMSTGTKIIIGVFAVIMALSMMLPSLASIFASDNAAEEAEAAEQAEVDEDIDLEDDATDEETDDEADDETADEDDEEDAKMEGVPDNETLQSLAQSNAADVEKYEARLKENPEDLAALLNLGQTYMSWGYSAVYSSSTDEETTYANGLIDKAVDYFDQYLALNDSNAVKVDQALCEYYRGDSDKAVKALESLTEDQPDYPLAWANLGMLYESTGSSGKATDAYRKAVELDADDEYGVASYANQRIISLNSTVSSLTDTGDASIDNIDTAPEAGLSSALSNEASI